MNNRLNHLYRSTKKLEARTHDLHKAAGILIESHRAYTLADVADFQLHWQGKYQIIVVSSTTLNMPAYTGKSTHDSLKMNALSFTLDAFPVHIEAIYTALGMNTDPTTCLTAEKMFSL